MRYKKWIIFEMILRREWKQLCHIKSSPTLWAPCYTCIRRRIITVWFVTLQVGKQIRKISRRCRFTGIKLGWGLSSNGRVWCHVSDRKYEGVSHSGVFQRGKKIEKGNDIIILLCVIVVQKHLWNLIFYWHSLWLVYITTRYLRPFNWKFIEKHRGKIETAIVVWTTKTTYRKISINNCRHN